MTHYAMMKWLADREANINYHFDLTTDGLHRHDSNFKNRVIEWHITGHRLMVVDYTHRQTLADAIEHAVKYERKFISGRQSHD